MSNDQLWMDSNGFVYSADGRTLLKGASVEGAYWMPEGVEEIEPEALIGCRIGTLHIPWTAHVHEYDQLVLLCSMAFGCCRQFVTLSIPRSVRIIGDFVFGPGGGKIVIRS